MTGIPVSPGELVGVDYLNEVARGHYRKVTSKQVVNSIAETDLLNGEITIDAGSMSTNRLLRLTAVGDFINNSAATRSLPRFKIKLGATTIIDTGAGSAIWGASALRFGWRIEVMIANLGAANAQWVHFDGRFSGAYTPGNAFFTTGEGVYGADDGDIGAAVGGASAAIDTTAAQALVLSVINPVANALLDVTLKAALVEIV